MGQSSELLDVTQLKALNIGWWLRYFLSTLESEPRGPVEQPVLEAPPLRGDATAMKVSNNYLTQPNAFRRFGTKHPSFGAVSAGDLNFYVFEYPRMNLGGSPDAKEHLEMCLESTWTQATEDCIRFQGKSRVDFDIFINLSTSSAWWIVQMSTIERFRVRKDHQRR
ncbi:uncharacterized protein CPUR_05982 [Claviceps purpurea 20.1]|uniref:Uncharacterized protein n=1 Tax=Claviceps purpurea (strain 20.1) TaxID=1111077 RepID=M1WDE1_CLAP2|nr:uncharacterized protein CPUR_05982 [Claviceps purpurea 20.1]